MTRTRLGLLLGACAALLSTLSARAARPIEEEQFTRLQRLIKPDPGEDKWARIPWLTSLWTARQTAARLGKPILLWEMDGHPLGCT
jgi:hypothetical protein